MAKIYHAVVYCLFFLFGSFSFTNAQQVFKTTDGSVIGYLEYLPQGYNSNSDKYPIVFFFHGVGERGVTSTDPATLATTIDLVTKHGPPQLVKNGTQFPFILISPQLKSSYSTWTTAYMMEVINYCKTYLRIDEKRICVTGLSLGGGGTWFVAQDHPELFAAVAPVCGGYNTPSKACGIAAENLPVWAFHGDSDTTVPYSKSVNMVNAINNCLPTPSPLALMTIYPGVGHNAWDYAYKNDHTLHNPNVYEWMMSYKNLVNKGNQLPTANAGGDLTVNIGGASVTGTGTDADGTITSYKWTKISGPSVTITDAAASKLSLTDVIEGTYVFKLTVTDNSGNTDSDYVKVSAVPHVNLIPTSNAGVNQAITLPVSAVSIVGAGTDTDGTIASYTWSKVSGATATMSGTSTATLSLSGLTQGSFVFRLTVTDNEGASASDDVTVTVNPPVIPVVNAGTDKLIVLPTSSSSLTGTASDTGGSIVKYQWTKVSGGSCTLTNATSATLKISGLATSGCYVFRLTATDNDGYTNSDDVTVNVNAKPVANAGADQAITLPMSSPLYLNGVGTDADGTIVKYLWSKYSGPNILAENQGATFKINQMYEGTYVFKLAVTDNLGTQGYDYVTITVSNTGTSSARTATQSELAMNDGNIDIENIFKGGASFNKDDMKDYTVSIYDESGEKIYHGPWSPEQDEAVLTNGLYIYNVFKEGVRVNAGKIFRN